MPNGTPSLSIVVCGPWSRQDLGVKYCKYRSLGIYTNLVLTFSLLLREANSLLGSLSS